MIVVIVKNEKRRKYLDKHMLLERSSSANIDRLVLPIY